MRRRGRPWCYPPGRLHPVPACVLDPDRLASIDVLGDVDRSRPEGASDERALIDGRYRLDGVLGRGGMATVHRGHDTVLGRDVAVKVFPAVHEDADELLRNQAEIRVLATLSHPGLVTVHDAGSVEQADGSQQVYLVMELVDGPTLAERVRRGPLDLEQTAHVGHDVAEALAEVHAHDIIHRDIKPANVLLTSPDALENLDRPGGPAVKLADFGIARLADATRLTMTGVTLGTVRYLSPEQTTGSTLGPASDVYALGLVLIECATGQPAFSGTAAEVAAARLTATPDAPPELGPELGGLLRRMTRMAPEDRPTAAEVADELAAVRALDPTLVLSTSTPVASHTAPPEPGGAGRWRRPRASRLLLAAGAVAVLAFGALLLGPRLSRPDVAPDAPTYPTVQGTLGDSLTRLQESVEP